MDAERREALLKEYGEVGNNFRTLTDIRFRLLTLLPVAAAATAAFKTDALSPGRLPLSLFGLAATIGLVTYNARNDQLYDALVGRAAAIERSLGLQDGAFANRPRSWLCFRIGPWKWEVNHRSAISTLYLSTIAFWLFMSLDTTLAHAWQVFEHLLGAEWGKLHIAGSLNAGPTLSLVSMLGAALVSLCGMSWLKAREKNRREELRIKAHDAVDQLLRAERYVFGQRTISSPESNRAPHYPPEDTAILGSAVEDRAFLQLCARIRGDDGVEKVKAVALFYSGLGADALRHYVPQSSGVTRAAFLLSLLVDLPPQWISDAWSNRRGIVPHTDRQLNLTPAPI